MNSICYISRGKRSGALPIVSEVLCFGEVFLAARLTGCDERDSLYEAPPLEAPVWPRPEAPRKPDFLFPVPPVFDESSPVFLLRRSKRWFICATSGVIICCWVNK